MKLLSLVFSFKNEEKNLRELIERTARVLKEIQNCNYELIFVNDNSSDNSQKIILELQKDHPITLINLSRTFGRIPSVIAGFRKTKGNVVIYMDTDLQDPPEIIPEMLEKYEQGSEIVHTIRTRRLGESSLKMVITKFAYRIINFFSDIPLEVNAGDFKLISRKALDKILEQKEFKPYVRGLSVWVGFKQSIVKYVRQPRYSGETKYPLFSFGPISEFVIGITSYSNKPLFISILFSVLSILISFFLVIYALYAKFSGIAVPGTTSVIIAISFFSSIILFSIGLTGIYIARIFDQTKGRDQYVIKDIFEKE